MKIPQTDSIRELAEFWDNHDLTDFEGELEEVRGPVFERKRADAVMVPLTTDEHRAIKQIAAARGIGEATLIREWVKEKLHHPNHLSGRSPRDPDGWASHALIERP